MSISELTVLIRCHDLPDAQFNEYSSVRLGVQCKQDVEQDVPGDSETALFKFNIEIKYVESEVDFRGPYVHGPKGSRFLYLTWGERITGVWQMFRRLKIHLSSISMDTLFNIENGNMLEASISMTGRDGTPKCGSVSSTELTWVIKTQ